MRTCSCTQNNVFKKGSHECGSHALMFTHPRYDTHSQLTLTSLTCSLRIHVALVSVVENVDGDEQDNDADEDEDGNDNQHPPQITPLHILL